MKFGDPVKLEYLSVCWIISLKYIYIYMRMINGRMDEQFFILAIIEFRSIKKFSLTRRNVTLICFLIKLSVGFSNLAQMYKVYNCLLLHIMYC